MEFPWEIVVKCLVLIHKDNGYFAKLPFRPIPALPEKFYPRYITHIPVVKFFSRLGFEQKC